MPSATMPSFELALTLTAPRASTGVAPPAFSMATAWTPPTASVTNAGAKAPRFRMSTEWRPPRGRSSWRAATVKAAVGPRPLTDDSGLPTTAPAGSYQNNGIYMGMTWTPPTPRVGTPP